MERILSMPLNDMLFVITIILLVVIGMPQSWKGNNSWWFAVIKFWFWGFPLMMCGVMIMIVFTGPLIAIHGLFHWDYSTIVTFVYLYVCIGMYIETKLSKKQKEFLNTL